MIRRLLSLLVVAWVFGFLWFAIGLPQPAPDGARSDAIVVPTGGGGRIARGIAVLQRGSAERMLVTGVDTEVQAGEFATQYDVRPQLMTCCITLGYDALDTRGNARETARWVIEQQVRSIRLVTSDWHMRRAALELSRSLPNDIPVLQDAVKTEPSLWILFLEYHKLIATWLVQAF